MAKHEFGLMADTPGDERYDCYAPEKYSLVAVEDEDIEKIAGELDGIPCYWHTLRCPRSGLAYHGITLIPPESAASFIAVFQQRGRDRFARLTALFEQAKKENKYILHYGI